MNARVFYLCLLVFFYTFWEFQTDGQMVMTCINSYFALLLLSSELLRLVLPFFFLNYV